MRSLAPIHPLVLLGLLGASACSSATRVDCAANPQACKTDPSKYPPKIYVEPPFGVGFSCVTVGCDDTRSLKISNRGGGKLNVSTARLTATSSTDFSLSFTRGAATSPMTAPSTDAPVTLLTNQSFTMTVRYTPSDALIDTGSLRIDWYDGAKQLKDADVRQVTLAVEARQLGDATANLLTKSVNFGYVAKNQEGVQSIEIENASGNAVLSLTGARLVDGSSNFYNLDLGASAYANPGDKVSVPVRFAPLDIDAYYGTVELTVNDPVNSILTVPLLGTSISGVLLDVREPTTGTVDFGTIRQGEAVERLMTVRNIGGEVGDLSAALNGTADGYGLVAASLDLGPIKVLEDVGVTVRLRAPRGGALVGSLTLSATGKGSSSIKTLALTGQGDAPRAVVTPTSVDFGSVANVWSGPTSSLLVSNAGVGTLVISAVEFDIGTALQFRLPAVMPLPYIMSPTDPPYEIPLTLLTTPLGAVTGTLIIRSNSIDTDTIRVPLAGTITTCASACPVINGAPDCSGGVCQTGVCSPGWHDTDGQYPNGCECQDVDYNSPGTDAPNVCPGSPFTTVIGDNCAGYPTSSTITKANLPTSGDLDVYTFRAVDGSSIACDITGDSWQGQVQMSSSVPGMMLCVSFGGSSDACGGYTNNCVNLTPSGTQYSAVQTKSGSYGTDDTSNVTVGVKWQAAAAVKCGAYSLTFRSAK